MTVQHLPCFDHVTDECTSSKTSQEVLFYTNVLVTRCDTILWVGYNFCTRHNLSSYLHFSGYIFMFLGIWLMGILTWVEWVFEAERIPAACGRLQGLESVGHVLQNINVCLQLDMYIIYNIYIYIFLEVQWLLFSMIISWFLCVKYSKTRVLWVPPVYCWLQMACPVGVYSFTWSIVWEIDATHAT